MEKKNEDLKALRLFVEEIERKIAHLFLLLNSAQDRFEELTIEEEDYSEEEPESPVDEGPWAEEEWKLQSEAQKKWDRITRPTILRSRKIPEKSGNKK